MYSILNSSSKNESAPDAKVEGRSNELLLGRDNLNETGGVVHLSERLEYTSGDEPAIPHIAGLDITSALSRLDGDRKLYLRMLRTFFDNRSSAVADIEDALSAGNTKLALHHANSVKCIAGTMGAVELERLALVVKNAVVFNVPTALVRVALDRFGVELDRLVTDLASHFKGIPLTVNDLLPEIHDAEKEVCTPHCAKFSSPHVHRHHLPSQTFPG